MPKWQAHYREDPEDEEPIRIEPDLIEAGTTEEALIIAARYALSPEKWVDVLRFNEAARRRPTRAHR